MKIPTTLLYRVLLDEGLQVGCAIERDIEVIRRRFEHEGMSFLTIALPTLSEALEKGLSVGCLTPLMFNGFKPFKRGGRLPGLLSGFFRRVFNEDGTLLEHPCIDSIRAIRQVSRLYKKVELPCSSARNARAYERYVSNDEEVKETGKRWKHDPSTLAWVCGHLWSDLEGFSGELFCFPGLFGSGATSERLKLNERHSISEWPARSEMSFPAVYHANPHPEREFVDKMNFLTEEEERPVRVVQVPKTLKTPRTISVEPSYMMLMQQSIAKPLMAYLESNRFPYKSIRFTDQSVNRELARRGSIDGSLATIDLSDASDLVSNDLVKTIFKGCSPTFLDLIQDCRTSRALLPDSSEITLAKFASMGSALCFPIEAMVFFTIACYSLLRQTGRRPSKTLLKRLTARVSVYGDDIIVPTQMASGLMTDLEAFGLRVNHEKSFSAGHFRESCGGDYYKGVDVTPTYCRRIDLSGNTRDPQLLAACVSLSNQLYLKGYWHACQTIRDYIETSWKPKYRIPIANSAIGGLHYVSLRCSSGLSWDRTRHNYRVRAPILVPRSQDDRVSDERGALQRAFTASDHFGRMRLLQKKLHASEWQAEPNVQDLYSPVGHSAGSDNGPKLPRTRLRSRNVQGGFGCLHAIQNLLPGIACIDLQQFYERRGYVRDPQVPREWPFVDSTLDQSYQSIDPEELVRYFNAQSKAFLHTVVQASGIDFDLSNRPRTLKLKYGWASVNASIWTS